MNHAGLPLSLHPSTHGAFIAARQTIASPPTGDASETFIEFDKVATGVISSANAFRNKTSTAAAAWAKSDRDHAALNAATKTIVLHGELAHALAIEIDLATKQFSRLVEAAGDSGKSTRSAKQAEKSLHDARASTTVILNHVRYFVRHAQWLQDRFPDAEFRDVPGLVRLVNFKDLENGDWSLTPGRYVGIAAEEEHEDFDFGETMQQIHGELADLNAEAADLAATIATNLEVFVE